MEALLRRLEQAALAIAGLSIIAIMLVVSLDTLLRYSIHSPLPWSFDLVSYYLMVVAAYFALSDTYTKGDHISITLLRPLMPRRFRSIVDIVIALLALIVFAIASIGAWASMLEAYRDRSFLPGYISWPVWLSYLPVAIGTAVLVLRLAHHCVTIISLGHDPYVHAEGESAE